MMDGFERVALRWEKMIIGAAIALILWEWLVMGNAAIKLDRCLRDWPLAECQARKDAGVMPD